MAARVGQFLVCCSIHGASICKSAPLHYRVGAAVHVHDVHEFLKFCFPPNIAAECSYTCNKRVVVKSSM